MRRPAAAYELDQERLGLPAWRNVAGELDEMLAATYMLVWACDQHQVAPLPHRLNGSCRRRRSRRSPAITTCSPITCFASELGYKGLPVRYRTGRRIHDR